MTKLRLTKSMKYINSIFLVLILCTGCSVSDNEPPEKAVAAEAAPQFEIVDLSRGGLPLALKTEPGVTVELDARWNPAFGRMELSNAHDMSIFIVEDTLSVASKKADIEGEIFTISYLIETDSLILYKSTLPDGSTPYWHFFASFPVGNAHYIFENNPLIECTEGQIRAMTDLVGRIHGLNKEAQ